MVGENFFHLCSIPLLRLSYRKIVLIAYLGHAMRNVTKHMRTARPRSAYASMQSDQVLHCQLTESLDTTECMNGEQRPRRYFAPLQDGLNLHILCMFHLTQSSLLSELLYIYINVCVVTATCLADDCLDCSSQTQCRRCAYFLAEGSRECLVKCTGEAKFVYSGEIQGSICVGKFLSTYLVFPF